MKFNSISTRKSMRTNRPVLELCNKYHMFVGHILDDWWPSVIIKELCNSTLSGSIYPCSKKCWKHVRSNKKNHVHMTLGITKHIKTWVLRKCIVQQILDSCVYRRCWLFPSWTVNPTWTISMNLWHLWRGSSWNKVTQYWWWTQCQWLQNTFYNMEIVFFSKAIQ